jgi:hypothetical protein
MKTRIIPAFLLVFGLLAAAPAFAQKTTKKKTETVNLFAAGKPASVTLAVTKANWERLQRNPFIFTEASVIYEGQKLGGAGVRYKGNSTFGGRGPHKSFKVNLGYFGGTKKLHGQSTLNLHHPFKDPSRVREVVSYELFAAAGIKAPRATHVTLTLRVPGVHDDFNLGVYSLVEQVDKKFLGAHYPGNDGDLFKIEGMGDPFGESRQRRRGGQREPYEGFISKEGGSRGPALSYLLDAVRRGDGGDLEKHLDVRGFLLWLAANHILANLDSYTGMGHNGYIYAFEKNRFAFIPWDMNEAFGKFTYGRSQTQMEGLDIFRPFVRNKILIDRVLEKKSWRALYLANVRSLMKGPFSEKNIVAKIQAANRLIAAAVRAEKESEHPLSEFDESLDTGGRGIAGFATRRARFINRQLADKNAIDEFLARGPGRGESFEERREPGRGRPASPFPRRERPEEGPGRRSDDRRPERRP